MILSQLVSREEIERLDPQELKEMLLKLDDQITRGAQGEQVYVSLEAQVLGTAKTTKFAGKEPQGIRPGRKSS
jgi:hypothetical protein